MDEIISGICYPLFFYLVFSLMGLLAVMLKQGKNSSMISFLIFISIMFSTLFINIFCYHNWESLSWISFFICSSLTFFLIIDNHFGNVNILGFIASLINMIYKKFIIIYNAFAYITSS